MLFLDANSIIHLNTHGNDPSKSTHTLNLLKDNPE